MGSLNLVCDEEKRKQQPRGLFTPVYINFHGDKFTFTIDRVYLHIRKPEESKLI